MQTMHFFFKRKFDRLVKQIAENDWKLTVVSLSDKNVGDAGAKKIAEALWTNTTVTKLVLEGNKIGDEGAKALAEALKNNATLTYLYLWGNKIGAEGATALAEALKHNATLGVLSLVDNNIGMDGAKALAEALKQNATLAVLDLSSNDIDEEMAAKIKKLVRINEESPSPQEAHQQKVAEFGPPPSSHASDQKRQSAQVSRKAHAGGGLVRLAGQERTRARAEQERRDRELAEKIQREEEEAVRAAHEEERIADKAHAEEERHAKEVREARVAEERRVAKEARLAEEAKRAEEAHLAEEARLAEETSPTKEACLEEARLVEEAKKIRREEEEGMAGAVDDTLSGANQSAAAPAVPKFWQAPHNPSCRILLTSQEHEAVRVLTTKLAEFERSLESVRGLPDALGGMPQDAQKYFRIFTGTFERTYVAAQALSTGAVRGDLMNAKDNMMCAILNCVGQGADKSNLPFVGCLSIFATVYSLQRQTRQNNLLQVFQDFYRGDSRDHYLLTYRRIAEEICLRVDWSRYAANQSAETSSAQSRVQGLIERVQKQLQSAHLLAFEDLEPIALKVMDDLSMLTKGSLKLWVENQAKFNALKHSDEGKKASFALNVLGIDAAKAPRQHGKTLPPADHGIASSSVVRSSTADPVPTSSQHPNANQFRAESACFRQELNEVKGALQEAGQSSGSRNESTRFRALEKDVQNLRRKLERLDPSDGSVDVDAGGGQAQAMCLRSKNSKAVGTVERKPKDEQERLLNEMHQKILELQNRVFLMERQVDDLGLNQFVANRVLTLREAMCLIKHIMLRSSDQLPQTSLLKTPVHEGILVDSKGFFVVDGRKCRVGDVPGKLGKATLWDRNSSIKISQDYNGTKSLKHWFEANGLGHRYELHINAVVHQLFPCEIETLSVPEEATQNWDDAAETDRDELFAALK